MKYDVIVIGSGPGGYVSAIRCSQLGMKTMLVEKDKTLGGTCLNVGCIPTKTLLEMTSHVYDANKQFKKFGINIGDVTIDYPKMLSRKESVIQQNAKGISALLSKNGVDVKNGRAAFESAKAIKITEGEDQGESIEADRFILATGSEPASLPFARFDHQRILSSSDMLSLQEIPNTLTIIGAGVIGLEIATIFTRLGTKVEILEVADSVLPYFDGGLCKELLRSLKKLGLKFKFNCKVEEVTNLGQSVRVAAVDDKGNTVEIEADYCMSATGRKPYTKGLNLDTIGVEMNADGSVKVNETLRTSVESIYAIGDATGGLMLAHKASEEGIYLAEVFAGKDNKINYKAIPSVVYTSPETASVGYTEEELVEQNIPYKTGVCQNRSLGRAHTADKLDGFAKVLIDKTDHTLLGIHLVAPHASEMIGEAVIAYDQKLTADQLIHTSHAHPTFLEAVKEACQVAVEGRGIHVV